QLVFAAVRLSTQRKVGGLWGGSAALLLAALRQQHRGRLLVVTADDVDSLQLQADLACFGAAAALLPRQETAAARGPEPQTRSDRYKPLLAAADEGALVIAGIEALLQPAPAPAQLRQGRVQLRRGQACGREELAQRALAAGLRSVPLVLAPGELSVRG